MRLWTLRKSLFPFPPKIQFKATCKPVCSIANPVGLGANLWSFEKLFGPSDGAQIAVRYLASDPSQTPPENITAKKPCKQGLSDQTQESGGSRKVVGGGRSLVEPVFSTAISLVAGK
jgi:hypothetical protein